MKHEKGIMNALKVLLDRLEESLDAADQTRIGELHKRALAWEPVPRLPLVIQYPVPDNAPFRPFPYREAFVDPEKMLFNELVSAFDTSVCYHAEVGDDLPFGIRANYGTVVIASLFGGKVEPLDDNPPWVRADEEGARVYERILDSDPNDFTRGLGQKVIDTYRHYAVLLEDYPVVRRCVRTILPDLQGPFDNLELLAGSGVYIDLYDKTDVVRRCLDAMAKAQVGFARLLHGMISDSTPGFCQQQATLLHGNILIRGDSAINVSADMYADVIAPYDEFVLKESGGGGLHFCGKGDHLVDEMLKLPSLVCLDMGQPEMNDLDVVYQKLCLRKLPLVRARVPQAAILSGDAHRRFPTGASLMCRVESLEHAKKLMGDYIAEDR